MKKAAIILDGGFVQNCLKETLGIRNYPDSTQIYNFATSLVDCEEEIFRIFFYHGEPFRGEKLTPISKEKYNFTTNPLASYTDKLFKELGEKDYIALRRGETLFRGWKLRDRVIEKLNGEGTRTLTDKDFQPELTQKGVDIRIGLDVAWLANNRIVDRIILVSGDSDFIPAMKFVRKEGIQVVTIKIGDKNIKSSLLEHSDLIREVNYSNGSWSF